MIAFVLGPLALWLGRYWLAVMVIGLVIVVSGYRSQPTGQPGRIVGHIGGRQ